jgi:hypothetical protein
LCDVKKSCRRKGLELRHSEGREPFYEVL